MKNKKSHKIWVISLLTVFFIGCTSNLLPTKLKSGISDESKKKAEELLKESVEAQGYGNIADKQAYRLIATDTWRGFMGTMGKIWPQKKSKLKFTYPIDVFDGQVEYLGGKKKGFKAAIRNDTYYVMGEDGKYKEVKKRNKKVIFGIEAYKFFTQIAQSMLSCEYLGYGGEEEYRGKNYDLVFGTWGSIEPNPNYDHFLIYINKETKLIDRATFTIRENYMPMPGDGMLYGNIVYQDYRDVDGLKVPFKQTIFDFDVAKKLEKYLHEFVIEEFEFIDIEETQFE